MKLVFTPDWFLEGDVLIEFFSFAILFLFFIFAYRNYKLSKNKNFLYLGSGFLLVALAELATVLTKLLLYYDFYASDLAHNVGKMIVSSNILSSIDFVYYAGFFFNKLLTLAGFYIIYRINMEKQARKDIILAAYFLIIIALFSCIFHYYLFHLTVLLLIIFIMQNYSAIYEKNKSKNTIVLIFLFGMLALSQIIFLFSNIEFYAVIAQIIQLVSYLILLFLMMRIIGAKNDKQKKKQDRDNIRYAGNNTRKRR